MVFQPLLKPVDIRNNDLRWKNEICVRCSRMEICVIPKLFNRMILDCIFEVEIVSKSLCMVLNFRVSNEKSDIITIGQTQGPERMVISLSLCYSLWAKMARGVHSSSPDCTSVNIYTKIYYRYNIFLEVSHSLWLKLSV